MKSTEAAVWLLDRLNPRNCIGWLEWCFRDNCPYTNCSCGRMDYSSHAFILDEVVIDKLVKILGGETV